MKTARKISMELGKMVGGRGRSYQVRATLLGGIYDEEKVHTERSLSWGASRTCHSLGVPTVVSCAEGPSPLACWEVH